MLSRNDTVTVDPVALETSISAATKALLDYRQPDGHWVRSGGEKPIDYQELLMKRLSGRHE